MEFRRIPGLPPYVFTIIDGLKVEARRAGRDVVDLGGGTGGFAVRLAESGHRVRVVDPSPDALAALATSYRLLSPIQSLHRCKREGALVPQDFPASVAAFQKSSSEPDSRDADSCVTFSFEQSARDVGDLTVLPQPSGCIARNPQRLRPASCR